jgi:hypothetical protein
MSEQAERTSRPIRVHLDTSDYASMYRAASGTPESVVRDQLLRLKNDGLIEIGLSFHVVYELLQDASPEYREDRLARAKLLTRLCGQNAFPYPTDLGSGYGFSKDGLWVPRIDLDEIEIEYVVTQLIGAIERHRDLSRHERRILSRRSYVAEWARAKPADFTQIMLEYWPLPFGREIVEREDLRLYILGELPRDEINKALHFYITDPETLYKVWFETYKWDNPVPERRDKMAGKLMEMLAGYKRALDEQADLKRTIDETLGASGDRTLPAEGRDAFLKLKRDLKTFHSEITSPDELSEDPAWIKIVGTDGAQIASQIFYGFYREKREIKRSDAIDMIHAMYLPHTDLWRGDRAFSDLLIKNRVLYYERVVPTLAGLPQRIEAAIAKGCKN